MGWVTPRSPVRPRRLLAGSMFRQSSTVRQRAEAERTATIRPAPDTMTYVTALLPVTKGVGVYAARNNSVEVVQPRCRTRYETFTFPATRVYGLSRELHPPIGQPTNGECPGLDEPAG